MDICNGKKVSRNERLPNDNSGGETEVASLFYAFNLIAGHATMTNCYSSERSSGRVSRH